MPRASTPMSAVDLIAEVVRMGALVQAETDAARRSSHPSLRLWHMEKAENATIELLGLINGPEHAATWQRIAGIVTPAWPLRIGAVA